MRRKAGILEIGMAVLLGLLATAASGLGQNAGSTKPRQDPAPAAIARLTIEVTGGDSNKPIENASVYVKTVEEHMIKDKKFEVNVKTNQKGVAHVPDPPTGKVLIQIVADGWKTYGQWHEITDQRQVVKIHLEKPPKWY